MLTSILTSLLLAVGVYSALGTLFALAFAFLGVGRVDPVAKHAGIAFKLAILPGCVALWPWLALRWLRARETKP